MEVPVATGVHATIGLVAAENEPDSSQPTQSKMPTLEVQLAKAQKDLAALEEVMKIGSRWEVYGRYYWPRKRADQQHGNDAELRGLRERVRHLQQRLAARIAQDEQRAAARTLVQLANQWIETYEPIVLPADTSAPTAPA